MAERTRVENLRRLPTRELVAATIALSLTAMTIWDLAIMLGALGASDASYSRAKDVFQGLSGIVGTVLGYYFGSMPTQAAQRESLAAAINLRRVLRAARDGIRRALSSAEVADLPAGARLERGGGVAANPERPGGRVMSPTDPNGNGGTKNVSSKRLSTGECIVFNKETLELVVVSKYAQDRITQATKADSRLRDWDLALSMVKANLAAMVVLNDENKEALSEAMTLGGNGFPTL